MQKRALAYYLEGYTAGTLTAEEQQELKRMLQDPANLDALNQLLDADWPRWEQSDLQFPEGFARVQQGVSEKIRAEMAASQPVAVPRLWLRRRVWAAASVLLLLAAGAYLWLHRPADKQLVKTKTETTMPEILPGKQGAVLTLADGSQVSLDTFQTGVIALQKGATATLKNGVLVYDKKGAATGYNTITTPKGRIFHIELPDGTGVWLNAASTLRYPVAFDGKTRDVQMAGEAYFEVTKDKQRPFRVAVNNKAGIEVLGTRFNINAYDNESKVVATLLSGAVKVSPVQFPHQSAVTLVPGQQAQISLGKNIPVEVVNDASIEEVMAWRNGLFNFEGLTLEEVMRQCERWYDVEVVYEKGIPQMELSGKMTRDVTLGQLLEGLKMFKVHYRLEERTLIILP